MLEPRSDAIGNSMTAFDYLRQGGVALGHGEEDFVVAIGSSSCGDTLEGDFEKNN